jgi:hypothetical protein
MQTFFSWGGEHPFLFVFFVLMVAGVLNTLAQNVRRRS